MWKVKKNSGGGGETTRGMTKSNNSLDERKQGDNNNYNEKKDADREDYKPVKVSEMRKRFERSNI